MDVHRTQLQIPQMLAVIALKAFSTISNVSYAYVE